MIIIKHLRNLNFSHSALLDLFCWYSIRKKQCLKTAEATEVQTAELTVTVVLTGVVVVMEAVTEMAMVTIEEGATVVSGDVATTDILTLTTVIPTAIMEIHTDTRNQELWS